MQRLLAVSDLPVGALLTRFRRAFYVHQAHVEGSAGPIELSFETGLVAVFRVGGDGESVVIEDGPWKVHFPEPVIAENQEFIWTSGSWEIMDVGADIWSHRRFIGRTLTAVTGTPNTVTFDFDGLGMRMHTVADEERLTFSQADRIELT